MAETTEQRLVAELTEQRLTAIRARVAAAANNPWNFNVVDDGAASRAAADLLLHARDDLHDLVDEVDRLRRPRWAWPISLVFWAVAIVGWIYFFLGLADG